MRNRRLVASLIVVAAFAGCGKHATEPPPPSVPGSPVLVASEPPARSSLVLYDATIWGQFDRDLDPRTIDSLGVFLKLDGQRINCGVAYEASTRKIHITSRTTLLLQRTYTVEFTPAIESAEGVPLAKTLFFQFTTNSLRRIVYDWPPQGGVAGPLTRLAWGGSQGPVNETKFRVYADPDSMSVANRTTAPLQDNVFTRLLPSAAWPRGTRIYWAVTSENVPTHELMHGPVTWFDVIGDAAVERTLIVHGKDHGSRNAQNTISYCANVELPCGPAFNGAIHWNLVDLPLGALITGATVRLAATQNNRYSTSLPFLTLSQNEWVACSIVNPGPPYPEVNGMLSTATPVDTIRVDFSDPRLGAFFEAYLGKDPYTFGTLVRALSTISYSSPLQGDPTRQPFATIRYVLPTGLDPKATSVRNARHAKPSTRLAAPGVRRLTPR
jgi:hypothetical protein